MDNKDQALRPEVFSSIPAYIQQEKHVDVETLTEEEKILAQGAANEFWKTLKGRFIEEIQLFDRIAESTMSEGKSFDEIGRTALVVNHVKGVINRVIRIVEDAKEAQDARGATPTE